MKLLPLAPQPAAEIGKGSSGGRTVRLGVMGAGARYCCQRLLGAAAHTVTASQAFALPMKRWTVAASFHPAWLTVNEALALVLVAVEVPAGHEAAARSHLLQQQCMVGSSWE